MSVQNAVISLAGQVEDLQLWIANALHDYYVRLFKNDVTLDRLTPFGDFDEADFVGYVPWDAGPGYSSPITNGDNRAQSTSSSWTWTYGSGSGDQTIYGWYLTDASGTFWVRGGKFGTPVVLSPSNPVLTIQDVLTAVTEFG